MHGQVKGGASYIEQQKYQQQKEKKKKEEANALLASLFKNAQNMAGKKGEEVAGASQAINLYKDPREGTENMPVDTIITCKNFLDAVEDELYGWRWVCPNKGVKCQYRHMLPEGYVVTSKKDREKDRKAREMADDDQETLEEKIEAERAALPSEGLTPVTKESFFAWKEKRAKEKQAALEAQMKESEIKAAQGRATKKAHKGVMNGRALFTFNPELFKEAEVEETKEAAQVDENLFAGEAGENVDEVDFD